MKTIELLNKLKKYPVFNITIIEKITEKDKPYSRILVHRLKKNKLISEIEKDKYTLSKDPLIIASRIIWPCYISCWYALRYYNLTEQLPGIVEVFTTKKRRKKEIIFQRTKIRFSTIKHKFFFGFNKIAYDNFEIFIAEPEKAFIDSALFKKISFSEIREMFENNFKKIDLKKFVDYLIRIKSKSLIKRFGFVLDNLGKDYYSSFNKCIDHNYIVLDYSLNIKGEKNKKWKIIENDR